MSIVDVRGIFASGEARRDSRRDALRAGRAAPARRDAPASAGRLVAPREGVDLLAALRRGCAA